jgi:hypothetical protein
MMDTFYRNAMILVWIGSFLSVLSKFTFGIKNTKQLNFMAILYRFTFLLLNNCLDIYLENDKIIIGDRFILDMDIDKIIIENQFILGFIYFVRVFYTSYIVICIMKWYYTDIIIFCTGIFMFIWYHFEKGIVISEYHTIIALSIALFILYFLLSFFYKRKLFSNEKMVICMAIATFSIHFNFFDLTFPYFTTYYFITAVIVIFDFDSVLIYYSPGFFMFLSYVALQKSFIMSEEYININICMLLQYLILFVLVWKENFNKEKNILFLILWSILGSCFICYFYFVSLNFI